MLNIAHCYEINSFDAEGATIDVGNNDLTDNGYTFWSYEEGAFYPLSISSAVKRNGSNSIKFSVPKSNSEKDRMQMNVEINDWNYPKLNHSVWKQLRCIGFSVFIPSDFQNPDGWLTFH